ncbi:MAG: hypothetical protein U1F43_05835 [Myxococcota bacterium]
MSQSTFCTALAASALLVGACATAPRSQSGHSSHQTRVRGLRMGGYTRMAVSGAYIETDVKYEEHQVGGGFGVSAAAGYYVLPGLALDLDAAFGMGFDAREQRYPRQLHGHSMAVLVGGGATFYLLPDDWMASLAIGVANIWGDVVTDETFYAYDDVHLGLGFGVHALLGKEWRAGPSGLGVALDVLFASGGSTYEDLTFVSIGAAFVWSR